MLNSGNDLHLVQIPEEHKQLVDPLFSQSGHYSIHLGTPPPAGKVCNIYIEGKMYKPSILLPILASKKWNVVDSILEAEYIFTNRQKFPKRYVRYYHPLEIGTYYSPIDNGHRINMYLHSKFIYEGDNIDAQRQQVRSEMKIIDYLLCRKELSTVQELEYYRKIWADNKVIERKFLTSLVKQHEYDSRPKMRDHLSDDMIVNLRRLLLSTDPSNQLTGAMQCKNYQLKPILSELLVGYYMCQELKSKDKIYSTAIKSCPHLEEFVKKEWGINTHMPDTLKEKILSITKKLQGELCAERIVNTFLPFLIKYL